MIATPPRADLRTLAAEAVKSRATDVIRDAEGDYTLVVQGTPHELAVAVLAAVLPEHRRIVLTEAAEVLDNEELSDARGLEYAANLIRRLAAAAPPAGLSAPVPAGNAPAVPEEADGQRAGQGDDYGPCPHTESLGRLHLEWLAEVADLKGERDALRQHILDIDAHATPYGDIPDEPGWVGTYLVTAGALHRALGKIAHSAPNCQAEADRDRLAAQVAHYQRVVEQVRALHAPTAGEADTQWCSVCSQDEEQPQPTGWWVPWPCPTIAAVDALPDAGPHQHECACNRNWGGPCGPCVCEEPPRQGVWRLVCGAGNIPPNQTYATKGAAEDVMRLHDGACPGTHGVEFVPDAGTDQTEDDRGV